MTAEAECQSGAEIPEIRIERFRNDERLLVLHPHVASVQIEREPVAHGYPESGAGVNSELVRGFALQGRILVVEGRVVPAHACARVHHPQRRQPGRSGDGPHPLLERSVETLLLTVLTLDLEVE